MLTSPLRARFGVVERFDYYSIEALQQIVDRAAALLEVPIDADGASEIARRSRGTPRVSLRLLRRVRDFAEVRAQGHIDQTVARQALALLEIDELGLDDLDRRVLDAIINKFGGGPVGLDTMAASISEEGDTIMDVVEPYLLQLGFLDRTPRGRIATRAAYAHMQVPYPDAPPGQSFGSLCCNKRDDSAAKWSDSPQMAQRSNRVHRGIALPIFFSIRCKSVGYSRLLFPIAESLHVGLMDGLTGGRSAFVGQQRLRRHFDGFDGVALLKRLGNQPAQAVEIANVRS